MMRAFLAAIAAAAVLTALFFARPHATPGPPMRDFEAYYAAGQTWNAVGDPYSLQIWRSERALEGVDARRFAPLPFVGPPATLPLWSALARLRFSAANAVWRGVLILSALVLALAAIRLCGLRFTPPTILTAAIFALGFGPLTSAIALGQIALPAFACAVLALFFKPAGIFAWAQPNVALALLSQVVRRGGALAFAAAAAIFAAGCALIAGFGGIQRYLHVLREHSAAERFSAIQITPSAIAYGLGASGPQAIAIGAAAALAALGVWLFFVRGIANDAARFCATCALLPLAMPFFHEHDLVLLFLPAAYFTVRCERRLWPIAAAGALLCATDWLGLAQRPDGTVQTLLLVGAAGIALALLRRDLAVKMLLVPAGTLAAIAAAALLTHGHPAPIWPDAMHALQSNPHQGIAAVWHAEQDATGLFVRDPWWALLRCASLAGCALLAYAGAISSRSTADSRSPLPAPALSR